MDACDGVIVRRDAVASATSRLTAGRLRFIEGFCFSGAAAASCVFEAGVVLGLILPAVPQSTAV